MKKNNQSQKELVQANKKNNNDLKFGEGERFDFKLLYYFSYIS